LTPPERFAAFDLIFPLAAVGTAIVAGSLLWSNWRRPLNAMAAASLGFVAVYFALFYLVAHPPFGGNPRHWFRWLIAISPFSLVLAWLLKRASTHPATIYRDILPLAGALLVVAAALSLSCFTETVIPTAGPADGLSNGPGFIPLNIAIVGRVGGTIFESTELPVLAARGVQDSFILLWQFRIFLE
jgi:hypothetical protein